MASGFGKFYNTSGQTSGSGKAVVCTVVSQSVDTSARTVTVTVRAMASYYRTSGSWSLSSGTAIYGSTVSSGYIKATVNGSTATSSSSIGIQAAKAFTASSGNTYTPADGYVTNRSGYVSEVSKSYTYSYGTDGAAISGTWSASMYLPGIGSTVSSLSGSFTTDSISAAYVAPSGVSVSYVSSTWNSVTGSATVSNYGTPSAASGRYIEFGAVDSSATTYYGPRAVKYVSNASTTGSVTVTSSDALSSDPLTIKGLTAFKVGAYANNTQLYTATLDSTVRYTPPAPLQSIAYTQTNGASSVSVALTITGGSSTNNVDRTVTTYYRYSTDGGSSYSNWTSAGTGSPWTAKTATISVPYGASVVVQAYQYYTQNSETKTVSFTANASVAPSGGTTSVVSRTWNTITLSGSISSYGTPSDNTGRKLAIGVSETASSLSVKRENQISQVTSVSSTTITNSSIYPSATAITLKGMKVVYPYIWAYNGVTNQTFFNTTAYYLPPAPGTATYVYNAEDQNFVVSYTGVASNNVTDYTASALTRTVRYRNSASDSWTYAIQDVVTALGTTTNVTVDPAEGETATVESWMTYQGQQSEVTTISVQGAGERPKLYGSANGEAQLITELYARGDYSSVTGGRVRVYKLYASVDGVARPIYMRRGTGGYMSGSTRYDPILLDVDFGDRIYLGANNILHVYAASDITLDPDGYSTRYVDMILPVDTDPDTELQIEDYTGGDYNPTVGQHSKGDIIGIRMEDGFIDTMNSPWLL